MKNQKTWIVLCVAVVIVAVTWVVVRAFTPDRQRFHFHNPSTVFDSKTGRIYEISGDEKSVVEFDVVNGTKVRRVLKSNNPRFIDDAELDKEFNKTYESKRPQQK